MRTHIRNLDGLEVSDNTISRMKGGILSIAHALALRVDGRADVPVPPTRPALIARQEGDHAFNERRSQWQLLSMPDLAHGGIDGIAFAQPGPLEADPGEIVAKALVAGAVSAVTLGDEMFAYPLTSDNGYFLYYDKSVVTDPSTLESILADCEAAGKSFYFEINSGWYQTAFFFGAG